MSNFETTIQAYLDNRAKTDSLFAETYKKANKSIKECCKYIYSKARELAKGSNSVGIDDATVYGWAVHYYDEDDIKVDGVEGRGLLCFGNCGRGKTLICGKILPLLLNHYCGKVVSCYDSQQMNAELDAVKQKHIIYVDDIGTENLSVKYGEKRLAFAELADEAEKKGKLLILTTNLSIDELREKYGERTIDRLRAITKTVLFSGESLRK